MKRIATLFTLFALVMSSNILHADGFVVAITPTSSQYLDEVTWQIKNASNVVVASGGPYSSTSTTQIVSVNNVSGGPFTLVAENLGTFADNRPHFFISSQCLGDTLLNHLFTTVSTYTSPPFASPPPSITTLSPSVLIPGSNVTILGSNFTTTGNTVTIGGLSATIVSQSKTSIVATVPTNICNGTIIVTSSCGLSNSPFSYTRVAPTVSAITPTVLSPGFVVSITGTHFLPSGNVVTIGGINATINSQSTTAIQAVVPSGICNGNVVVGICSGLVSNPVSYTVTPPNILITSPTVLIPGGNAVIVGTNFSASGNAVTIGGLAATIVSQSPTSITVTVPTGICNGSMVVTTACGNSSSQFNYTRVAPTISLITPTVLSPGFVVSITGTHFLPSGNVVTIGGINATINSQSTTAIQAVVPSGICNGNVVVGICSGLVSNPVSYTVTPPNILITSPTVLIPGGNAVIVGTNFSASGNAVTIGGLAATIVSQSPTSITVTVPTGICNGSMVVTTACGISSSQFNYTRVAPTVSLITPTVLSPGFVVSITGTHFLPSGNVVTIGGINATINSQSTTAIQAVVPSGICNGNVVVGICSGLVSNPVSYTVTPPNILITSPTVLIPGGNAVIVGTNFSASGNAVTIGGFAATIVSQSPTSITVTVPTGICNGSMVVTTACGISSSQFNYTRVAPTISLITPTVLSPGFVVSITGTHFLPSGNVVTIGGINATINSQSTTAIQAVVPSGICNGNVVVGICSGLVSNPVSYTVTPPNILTTSPTVLIPGGNAVIVGTNFSASGNAVTIGGLAATIVSQSPTSITVTVPTGICNGSMFVTTACGISSSQFNYTRVAPTVSLITPTVLSPGFVVSITGTHFLPSGNVVTIGGINATINSQSTTAIQAVVPSGICNGNVVVGICSGLVSNTVSYSIPPPSITAVNPSTFSPGSLVTVLGTDFSSSGNALQILSTSVPILTQSNTSITFVAPPALCGTNLPLVVTNACGSSSNSSSVSISGCPISFEVRSMVQGYYESNGRMQPVLFNQGVSSDTTISDSIRISFIDSVTMATYYQANTVMNRSGWSQFNVPQANGNYYIKLQTRNGIETWSAYPISLPSGGGGFFQYNFTDAMNAAYGGNQFEVEPGVWTIYSGDVNQDLSIDAFDYLLVDPDLIAGLFGYLDTDLTGDGFVDAFDYVVLDANLVSGIGAVLP
jgi:hypothetical protein